MDRPSAEFRTWGVEWIVHFSAATLRSANLARRYLDRVNALMAEWRERLEAASSPRADAAAWVLMDVLPAHPVITGPVASAATGRSKGPVYLALEQLLQAGSLVPLSASRRNQAWEADGLLDLLEELEAGGHPAS